MVWCKSDSPEEGNMLFMPLMCGQACASNSDVVHADNSCLVASSEIQL